MSFSALGGQFLSGLGSGLGSLGGSAPAVARGSVGGGGTFGTGAFVVGDGNRVAQTTDPSPAGTPARPTPRPAGVSTGMLALVGAVGVAAWAILR